MTKANGRATCSIDHCDNPISSRSETKICHACYAAMHYWRGRTVGDILRRQRQLIKLTARMEILGSNRKGP